MSLCTSVVCAGVGVDALNPPVCSKGKTFMSTLEAVNYPIYITQWHPEKVQFEWDSQEGINHSYVSIQVWPL